MRRHSLLLLLTAFFPAVALSQTPVPSFTQTLHARKEFRGGSSLFDMVFPPSSVLKEAPDHGLLVLIPQSYNSWVLKRVVGWNTRSPNEETLAITDPRVHDGEASVRADLTVTPDGGYLIVRINSSYRQVRSSDYRSDAFVGIVDLRTFGIVSQRVITDPLIAGSAWQFTDDGKLIAKGIVSRTQEKSSGLLTVTDTYRAASLSIPGLEPSASCQYKEILESRQGNSGWTNNSEDHADLDCAAVLQAARVPSVKRFPGGDYPGDRIAKLLNFEGQMMEVSKDEKFALYSSGTGYRTMWDTIKTTSRFSVVVSVTDRKTILSIPLPVKQPVVGTFGESNDQPYLILLRDGIKLEIYSLINSVTN